MGLLHVLSKKAVPFLARPWNRADAAAVGISRGRIAVERSAIPARLILSYRL